MRTGASLVVILMLATLLPSASAEPAGAAADVEAARDAVAAWIEPARPQAPHESDPWLPLYLDIAQSVWAGDDASQPPPVPVPETEDESVSMHALGDVDGDGDADLLRVKTGGPTQRLDAVAAPELRDVLWTRTVAEDAYWYFGADVDGDAVREFVIITAGDSEGQGEGQGTPVGGAFVLSFAWQATAEVVSGKTGETLVERSLDGSSEYATAYAYTPVGLAGGSVTRWTDSFTTVAMVPGAVAVITILFEYESASASAVVVYENAYVIDLDVVVELIAPDGKDRATVEAVDRTRVASYPLVTDLTGDGVPDVALTSTQMLMPASSDLPPVIQTDLLAFDGKSGSSLWTLSRDPTVGYSEFLLPLGDVDDAGGFDVGYLELVLVDPSTIESRFIAYAGAGGAVLAERVGTNEFFVAIPFGQADDDAEDEVLTILLKDIFDFGGETVTVGMANADLKPVWTSSFSLMSEPISYEDTSDFGSGYSTDWTGDGLVDLALAIYEGDDYEMTVRLLDGSDGTEVWSRPFEDDVRGGAVVRDLTGDGARDFATLRLDGPEEQLEQGNLTNATINLTAHSGATGLDVWTQVLMDPGRVGNRSTSGMYAAVEDAGDVNADGRTDVLANVGQFTYFMIIVTPDGTVVEETSMVPEDEDPMNQWYVFSGKAGELLWAWPEVSLEKATPLLGPGANGSDAVDPPVDDGGIIPGPAVSLVLLLVVAAALSFRRRQP